jgi:hypothetical protein
MRKTVGIAAGMIGAAAVMVIASSCGSDTTAPSPKTYVANLISANEPNGASTATGTGVASFVDNGDRIDYTLSVTGLTAVSASHIHLGAAGVNGGIIFNLFNPNNPSGPVNGVIAAGIITSANNQNVSLDSLRVLFNNGNAYVNVHTSQFPAGAIRDQVRPSN